ncbi:2-C-methyl-D-erythritol 2,4-cyclodiphosphate synthase [Acanthopleuribacter pedis]|uniref:Bifunctional enzyme IspD/IspF n=1 Tax=Acanthopleuribacter pedis TaxID=442870 RepID=A0A8J7Q3G7_9BACT|nr:2-C-methyl-D-erythritol 2,4-cyclodiphosphate synthase [Acanthopleuribacter pedis]MBO1316936.1 2-C-methyl-D-erythritol 2,4-cyclodiphosphate synthase [Acanthopleuribacter pedis]
MVRRFAIIPAGGIGTRMGLPYPKQLLPLGSHTVLQESLTFFKDVPVFVPVPVEFRARFVAHLGDTAVVVDGGDTRFQSVKNAVDALAAQYAPDPDDLVAIHDAARPFLQQADVAAAWKACEEHGALIFAAPAVDTLKQVDADGVILRTLDRTTTYHAQTPQMFRWSWLTASYQRHASEGGDVVFTDEAGLVEARGYPITVFAATHGNRKITHREDLVLLESAKTVPTAAATNEIASPRIGHGYDVHRFAKGRPLFLGGVEIKAERGLLGHSDADVALHALIDALLGAAGRGDIGHWFPDDQKEFKDIRSTVLLERVWRDLAGDGYQLVNCDLTIQAQAPKLAPHLAAMRRTIAEHLECAVSCINIKATTTERLGFVGREEGMAADAVVLLQRRP